MRRQALAAPAEMHRYPGCRCGELVGRGGRGWEGLGLTAGRLVRAGGPLVYTLVLLGFSRSSAYGTYPLIMLLFLGCLKYLGIDIPLTKAREKK